MSSQNRITIVSVCDNHYIILLATLIKSIEVNHKTAEEIDYYIVEDNISTKNKRKLSNSTSGSIHIYWIKMPDIIPKNIRLPLDRSSFPLNIYARLFIPYFVPQSLKKVIYLDVDMIVLKDISELWHTDIGDHSIAGVVDRSAMIKSPWAGILNYEQLGLSPDTKYFNSGLLMINPFKWRDSNSTVKIIQCIKDNIEYANYPDQYGLNVVFAGQWLEIDPHWNCHSSSLEKSPYLIHFSGRKPIYKSYNNNEEYKAEFNKYWKLTAWSKYSTVNEFQRLLKKSYNKFEKFLNLWGK